MNEFFKTVMGRRFYEGTAPNIARQLERVANALEESNRIEREKMKLKDKMTDSNDQKA